MRSRVRLPYDYGEKDEKHYKACNEYPRESIDQPADPVAYEQNKKENDCCLNHRRSSRPDHEDIL